MAVTYVSSGVGHKNGGSGTDLLVARAASIVSGNFLLAFIYAPTTTLTAPSGWTLVAGSAGDNNGASLYVYQKTAGSSEPTFYTWSLPSGTASMTGTIRQYSGTSGIDGSVVFTINVFTTAETVASVTPSGSSDVWVACYGTAGGSATIPTGFGNSDSADTGSSGQWSGSADLALSSSSPTGTTSFNTSVVQSWTTASLLLAPAGSPVSVSATATTAPQPVVPTTATVTATASVNVTITASTAPQPIIPTTAQVSLAGPSPVSVSLTATTAPQPVVPTTAVAATTVTAQPKPNYSSVYMVRLVDMFGTPYAELVNAVVTNVTQLLNNWGSCAFNVPTSDPQLGTMIAGPAKIIEREVQVWRDPLDGTPPKLLFWGPIVRARATSQTVQFQANGLLWYYSRRYFGPILHNQITNGDFESGLTGWTATGATETIDTNIFLAGTGSLKLVSAAQETDQYASQGFVWSAGAQPDEIWVSAHAQIITVEGTAYIGPAFMERGLYVEVVNNATSTLIQAVWQPIDNSAPRNEWFRINAPNVTVPAGTTCTVTVRLYSVGGQINWDQVVARFAESQGADTVSGYNDVASIIATVNTYAQVGSENKSHLQIGGPSRGPIGVVIARQYQFYLNGNIWETCLSQLVTEGQCDLDVEWDEAGATRNLQCYVKKGSTKPQLALVMGGNVADFSVDMDGQATASSIRVVGQGISSEQTLSPPIPIPAVGDYVGYAFDTAANGGVVLESLESAPPDTSIDGVASLAANELDRLKNAVTVVTVTAKENLAGALIGQLETGDVIPVAIDYGWVQLSGNMRVVALALNPVDETLAVTLNADRPAGPPSRAPHVLAAVSRAEAQILDLQRGVPVPPVAASGEIIYTAPGAVIVSQSPAVTPKASLTIIGFSATLATAGTSTTTVVLIVNGATVATVSLAAGATYGRVPVANVAITGRLGIYAVGVTVSGTGATDLGGEIEVVTSSAAGLF